MIVIVIGIYGWVVEQLLKIVEMLLGEQENVGWIDFVLGENVEMLIEKYNVQLVKLDISKGVLFFVDIWGGSFFNVVSCIVVDKEYYEVIVGVNILMLVEIFMVCDDDFFFDELVVLVVEIGSEGVKVFKVKLVEKVVFVFVFVVVLKVVVLVKFMGLNDYMVIGFVCIDDCLIYGQVVICWIKEINVICIIVVSDEVVVDIVCKILLIQVVLLGVIVYVVDVVKMICVYNNFKYVGQCVMLLFINLIDVECIVEGGVKIISVNIGGMVFCQGKIQVNNVILVDVKDIEVFKKLNVCGIELEVCKVFIDLKLKMMDLIVKVDK